MKRRIISWLICCLLVLSLLPAAAHGATEIKNLTLSGFQPPEAGKSFENFLVLTTEEPGVAFHGIDWYDETEGRFLEGNDTFRESHVYTVQIWMKARDGYSFRCVNDNTPDITATLDGRALRVSKAFEYKAFAMVVLSYTFPAVGGHTHSYTEWQYSAVDHFKCCYECGQMFFWEDHEGGVATCQKDGICSVCGYAYLKASEDYHTPDTSKWTACGDLYHAHLCVDCGAHCDTQEHVAGPAGTPGAAEVCRDCGYVMTPAKEHVHQLTRVPEVPATCTREGTVAHYSCSGCPERFADAEGKTRLTALSIGALGHKTSDTWTLDQVYHWRSCTVCGQALEETRMLHEPAGGVCATCGYSSAVPIPETTPVTTIPAETAPPEPSGSEEAVLPAPGQPKNASPEWLLPLLLGVLTLAAAAGVTLIVLKRTGRKDR